MFETGAALVIGGTGGIGEAICVALAEAGSDVVLSYRSRPDRAKDIARQIEQLGVHALALQVDTCSPESVEKAVAQAIEKFSHIHSVVYAAGPAIEFLYINEISSQVWSNVINADVNGCFNVVSATLPHFRQRQSGNYVALITAAVSHAPPRDILSAAPKVAIEMLMKGVAREEGRSGIRANCVGPGLIAAGLGLSTVHDHTAGYVERMKNSVPLKRAGNAAEVANAVIFLLSSKASYISGASIPVAGGLQLV